MLKAPKVRLGDYLTMTKARYMNWVEAPLAKMPLAKMPLAKMPLAKSKLNSQKLWSNWSTWYESFVAEVKDEGHVKTTVATERWTTFAARSLHCSETEVRAWLLKAKPC